MSSTKSGTKNRRSARIVPRPTRVRMAAGYAPPGTKSKFLPWTFAERRLRGSHNYWVCSTRPDARPHAAPIWGVWLDGVFWFSTDPSSQKARNLKSKPAAVVHVESGDEVVIVEGTARPSELTKALDSAYFRKYKMHLFGFEGPMMIFKVEPKVIMAWREKTFPASATRWQFD